MDEKILLPSSQYINTNLGLKYFNGNKKLYLKILNSFLTRYQNFDINALKEDELKNEMHTLKGLSSTLGMESLSNLALTLDNRQTKELFLDFSETLTLINTDLRITQTKTLLIIDNNSDTIDNLIKILEDSYDIMVITDPNDDLKALCTESIDVVLLNPILSTPKIRDTLEQQSISIIEVYKPINPESLKLVIKNA